MMNGKLVTCAVCGKERFQPIAKASRPTCGWDCSVIYRRRPFGIRKKDGFICKDGYRMVYVGHRYMKQHRKVMSEVMGRDLKRAEVVHHWDENRLNNERENLALLRSQSAHQRLHMFAERHGIDVSKLFFQQPWLNAA